MQRIKRTLPTPKAALLIGCVSVGVSPFVVAYDDPLTVLWLSIALTAMGISASIMSTVLDDISTPLFFAVAICLNLALFSLPALAIFGAFRKRLPDLASLLILSWLVFYVLALFVLFVPSQFP